MGIDTPDLREYRAGNSWPVSFSLPDVLWKKTSAKKVLANCSSVKIPMLLLQVINILSQSVWAQLRLLAKINLLSLGIW